MHSAPPPSEAGDRTPSAPIRVRPTQQGAVYLWTLGLFSVFLLGFRAHLAFLLGSLALGCAAVAWVLARRNLAGLTAARAVPARTRVGRPTPLAWTLTGGARGTRIGLELEERPARGSKPVKVLVEMPVVPPGTTVRCEAEVVFARRGPVTLGRRPLLLASRYPLGLFRATRTVAGEDTILVRPAEGRVTPRLARLLRGRRPVEAQRRTARGDDVIYGVREYRDGDDPRRIHWRSSARRGTLAVTEWRTEQGREVLLVLGRGLGAGGRGAAHFERAVAATATIWRACVRQQLQVTLELGDGRRVRSGGDGRGLERGLDALARVAAQGGRAPRRALRTWAAAGGRRAVVYVTAGRQAGLERELAAAAGAGGRTAVVPAWSRALGRWVQGLSA